MISIFWEKSGCLWRHFYQSQVRSLHIMLCVSLSRASPPPPPKKMADAQKTSVFWIWTFGAHKKFPQISLPRQQSPARAKRGHHCHYPCYHHQWGPRGHYCRYPLYHHQRGQGAAFCKVVVNLFHAGDGTGEGAVRKVQSYSNSLLYRFHIFLDGHMRAFDFNTCLARTES